MAAEAQTSNPYHEARSIWNERYLNLVRARWNWQLIALVLAISNVIVAVALVWLSAQSKVVPYIVRVDEAGQSLVIGPATASTIADPKIIGFQLQAYVRDLRQVTADGAAQKNLLERVYRQTAGAAIGTLNDHFRAADPFLAARAGTVMPSVRNTLQLGDHTWQVEWVETRRTLEGKLSGEETWVGQFEVVVEPPTAAAELVANPLGFKVTRISWSRKF
jgi:type IV secretion system protein VirB5